MPEMLIQQQMNVHYTSIAQKEPRCIFSKKMGVLIDQVLLTYMESIRKTIQWH
jgi:hypothetical protein